MVTKAKSVLPRIGAHTPTSGGMAKRSIEYALATGSEAIQVFASTPRGWAMPDSNPEADAAFKAKTDEHDIEAYVHAPPMSVNAHDEKYLATNEYVLKLMAPLGTILMEGLECFWVKQVFNTRLLDNGHGLMVVDDYAHHPSEVKATVRAAKSGWLDSRVIAIFQPHLFSRTREFASEYGWALSRADMVYVADVYPAREKVVDYPGVDGELVAAAVRKAGGKHVEFIADMETLFSALKVFSVDGNMLLFMGAGDITHLASRVAESCRQSAPV